MKISNLKNQNILSNESNINIVQNTPYKHTHINRGCLYITYAMLLRIKNA